MSVSSVGTPQLARTTSSPVTGTWNGDQPRTANDLLVAIVVSSGTTSAGTTAQNAGTSGWSKQLEVWNSTSGSGPVLVAIWTKLAAGSDAAPAFTSTISGTAVMGCTLFELTGNVTSAFVDKSGTFSSSGSGSSSSSIATETVATGTAPTQSGEFAIVGFVRQRAAGTTGYTAGSGWTNAVNDGATSSTAHIAVDFIASPSVSGVVSDTGTWSGTATTAFGAGVIAVFKTLAVSLSGSAASSSVSASAGTVSTTVSGVAASASVSASSGTINISLPGSSASASVQAIAGNISVSLSGAVASESVSAVSGNISVSLSSFASASVSAIPGNISIITSGSAGSVSVIAPAGNILVNISGAVGSYSVSAISPSVNISVPGTAPSFSVRSPSGSINVKIPGTTASASVTAVPGVSGSAQASGILENENWSGSISVISTGKTDKRLWRGIVIKN